MYTNTCLHVSFGFPGWPGKKKRFSGAWRDAFPGTKRGNPRILPHRASTCRGLEFFEYVPLIRFTVFRNVEKLLVDFIAPLKIYTEIVVYRCLPTIIREKSSTLIHPIVKLSEWASVRVCLKDTTRPVDLGISYCCTNPYKEL